MARVAESALSQLRGSGEAATYIAIHAAIQRIGSATVVRTAMAVKGPILPVWRTDLVNVSPTPQQSPASIAMIIAFMGTRIGQGKAQGEDSLGFGWSVK